MDDDFGAAAVSTPALPPNWRSAKAADGKEYYFNELTGETSWTVMLCRHPLQLPRALHAHSLWHAGSAGSGCHG